MDQQRIDQLQVLSRALLNINAVAFFFYGLCFALFPAGMTLWVVDVKIEGASLLTDARATYGGMQMAIGVILYRFAQSDIRMGLSLLMILMVCMACTRALGFFIDGYQNVLMFIYLLAEVLIAFWARHLLNHLKEHTV